MCPFSSYLYSGDIYLLIFKNDMYALFVFVGLKEP